MPKNTKKMHRTYRRLGIALVLASLLVFVIALFASGPVSVPFLASILAAQGSRGPVTLTASTASVDFTDPDGIKVVVEDAEVGISGETHVTLQLPKLIVPLNRSALWSGQFKFSSLELVQPKVTIALKGGPAIVPEVSPLMEAVNRIANLVDDQFARRGLMSVSIMDANFEIEGPAPRSFDRISATVLRSADETISATAHVGGQVTSWQMDFLRSPSVTGQGTRMAVVVNGITLAELLGPNGAKAYGKGLRLPASAKIDSLLSEDGKLVTANAVARVRNGWFQAGKTLVAFDDAALSLVYRGENEPVEIQKSHFIRGNTRVAFTGLIERPKGNDATWRFQLESEYPVFGPSDVSGPPQMLDGVLVQGTFNLKEKLIDVDRFALRAGKAKADGVAKIQVRSDGPYVAIAADAERVPIDMAKKVWPITLAPPARKWIIERVKGGVIDKVSYNGALPPAAFNHRLPSAGWSGNDVNMTMSFSNGSVAPVGEVAVVSSLEGTATIANETLTVKASGGQAALDGEQKVSVPETTFEIYKLQMRTAKDASVKTRLEGGNAEVGRLLDAKPFEVLKRAKLTPDGVTGDGTVEVSASFPLTKSISMKDVVWNAVARSANFSDENPIMGHTIQNANLVMEANAKEIAITGNGVFDGLNADINLVVPLGEKKGGSRQDVVAAVTAEQLKEKGIDLTAFLDGPMVISAGKIDGGQNITIDLKDTNVQLKALGWTKSKGVPATATFNLLEMDEKNLVKDFELVSEGADVFGQIQLSKSGELLEATFPRFQLRPGDEADVEITRASNGRYDIIFTGKTFDGRGLINSLRNPGGSQGEGDFAEGARIAIDIARLTGFNGRWMTGVKGKVDTGAKGLEAADVSGLLDGRTEAKFTLVGQDGTQHADGRFEDTGAVLAFLDLYERMRGGKGVLNVVMADEDSWVGEFKVRTLVITEDPAIQKIRDSDQRIPDDDGGRVIRQNLQRASNREPRGTASFDTLDINFTREGDIMTISRGALRGNALGGTVHGTVDLANQTLSLTGTFVPVYALNNFFSKIPLLGFALGGSTGEGLIGVTYRLSGSLADPVLTVNPVSAIAPGIFRKMFEFQPN